MTRPETHYARSGELAIAYQVHGSGDRDLLVNTGISSNIETIWDIPEAARYLERLGRFARVIRFDRRDTGLSDAIRDDLTFEAHANDALAVIEAAGAEQPVLMGSLDGARSLALLAATRPRAGRWPDRDLTVGARRGSQRPRVRRVGGAGSRRAHGLSQSAARPSRARLGGRPGASQPPEALRPDIDDSAPRCQAAANVADERHRRCPAAGPGSNPGSPPVRFPECPS